MALVVISTPELWQARLLPLDDSDSADRGNADDGYGRASVVGPSLPGISLCSGEASSLAGAGGASPERLPSDGAR